MSRRRSCAFVVGLSLAIVLPSAAGGSIKITDGVVKKPRVKVIASGDAQVSWTNKAGMRKTLVVPVAGGVLPGATLAGRNVARKRRVPKIPFLRVLRRKPGGMFYALQYWRPGKRGPAELRFSRWTGDPTAVTLGSSVVGVTETIAGQAVFDGSGISGKTSTPGGTKKAIFVGLDCRGCPAGRGWVRIVSRKPQAPDGSFALRLKPRFEGNRYRVTIAGPNSGTQLAPDATATVASARAP